MKTEEWKNRIMRGWMKLRLQPIRVLCFHEIGNCCAGSSDWVPTEFLQSILMDMQKQGCTFISLSEAHRHIANDILRTRKYAVLTADDGLRCHMEILPWLEEHNIPITLCLNVTSPHLKQCGLPYKKWYHIKEAEMEQKYAEQLYVPDAELDKLESPLVTYALHGFNHNEAATDLTLEELQQDIQQCVNRYGKHPRYVPFYTYKYGKHNAQTDALVRQNHLIPVLSDGRMNYNDESVIHREIVEAIYKKWQQK